MAWMASNLYVKHGRQEAVADVVEELLRDGEHRRDQTGILDPFAPALVSPPVDGWVAVIRLGPYFSDLPWAAARLARELSCLAAGLEMVGNSYRMRYSEFRGEEEVTLRRTPEHGWQGEIEEPERMPLYEDAEAQGFDALLELGIPAELITLGLSPVGHDDASELDGALALSPEGDMVTRQQEAVVAVAIGLDDPPVLPTRITRDFGELLFEERYVEGAPSVEALDRLLEIEDTLLARARRAAPDKDVTLTVSYHAAVHQDRLNALLQGRDRLNLSKDQRLRREPWWTFWRFFGRMK